jgi:hypothetical protein
MDLTTLIIIIAVIALVMFFLNRNRMMPGSGNSGVDRPTYDDPNYASSGSIGGGPETLEERSVGGPEPSEPAYDDPKYRSGGSIGG